MAESKSLKPTRHADKLTLSGLSLTSLYLISGVTHAAIVHVNSNPHSVDQSTAEEDAGQVFWDVDGDGNNDFNLFQISSDLFLDTYDTFADSSLNGRGLVQTTGQGGDSFQRLNSSFSVGPSLVAGYQWGDSQQTFRTILSSGAGGSIGDDAIAGGFTDGDNLFGFRFQNASGLHYGWANLNIDLAVGSISVTEWAYEDVADTAIHVPDTGSAPSQVPLPPSLALLAMGAAGLTRMRRRPQAVAA